VENGIPITPEIEEQMVRYLLGELPPQDALAVENNYFENEEYFELIQALENELIRDYVRGEMAPDLRGRFEARYRSSKELAKKIEIAQAILAESAKIRGEERSGDLVVASGPRAKRILADYFLIGLLGFRWAAAVGVIAAIGLSVLLWKQNSQLRLNLAQVQRENRSLVEEKSAPDRAVSEKPKEPVLVASFILTPGLSRDKGNAERLIVPAAIGRVDFKLPLPSGISYPALRAVLERVPDGQVSSQDLPLNALVDSGRALVVGVPSASLRAGRYVLYVKGRSSQGEYEDVQYYAFIVAN
jgi:anti-sigma factor RsiW